ncbi:MAG TPA: DUF3891 family protein, partial [Candidatus Sulfotelmatobacter sp.]|nr:DUF3891 family protein [Candidatus Sulfotelmatobacter sp.]
YIVSRHFQRLAEQRVAHTTSNHAEKSKLAGFLKDESHRQSQLAAKQEHGSAELELLTDVLQFCDLLSLYVCSGAQDKAVFPEYFGARVRLTIEAGTYKLDPPVLETGAQFQVAALRHPAAAGASGQQLTIAF